MSTFVNADVKMTEALWHKTKFMTKEDRWGNPFRISSALVFNLENLRIASNKKIVLTCPAYTPSGGHTANSTHYLGKAADWQMAGATLLEMYIWAERFNFTGIGLYPNNGNPFMHTDVRDFNPMDSQSRWIAIGNPAAWTYIELTYENFKKHCL